MRLPHQTAIRERTREQYPVVPGGVAPQGCDIGCLISKAPHCVPKLIAGDIPGFTCGCV